MSGGASEPRFFCFGCGTCTGSGAFGLLDSWANAGKTANARPPIMPITLMDMRFITFAPMV